MRGGKELDGEKNKSRSVQLPLNHTWSFPYPISLTPLI